MKRNGLCVVLSMAMLWGCTGLPEGLEPVGDFDVGRYLGRWYEIARLDHRFERGLSNVSAVYTPRADGGLDVLNRGFDDEKGAWKSARGRAYFLDEETVGSLKVSFFRPFYGGYHILTLDRDAYAYALVCGASREYLWIMARERVLDRSVVDALLAMAGDMGFDTASLIFVRHDRPDAD